MSENQLPPMQQAMTLAKQARDAGEVPVGAVIVQNGKVIATARNQMCALNDATAHAEMKVISQAMKIVGASRLIDCDLFVTLEPCTMCAGAISLARLRRLYFAAEDAKAGAVENGVRFFDATSCHHRPEVIAGIGSAQSEKLLKDFFASRR